MTDTMVASDLGELLALRPGVYRVAAKDGGVGLLAWPHSERLGRLDDGQQAVLRALAGAPARAEELRALGDAERIDDLLDRLRERGWLAVTITHRGLPLYTLSPLRPAPPRPDLADSLVPSKFTLVRRTEDGTVAESPRAWCDVRVHDAGVLAVIGGLPVHGGLAADVPEQALRDLHWAGVLVAEGAEETDFTTCQWSPHELWFHDRSRLGVRGYLGDRFGGTFWAKDRFAPLPARPEPFDGPVVELGKPDLPALRRTDPTLTVVLEDRESVREQDDEHPLTVDQLGEFLYRCARTRMLRTGDDGQEYASRPHPSGGSVYELELYPVVRHVDGLEPGMYHYDSHQHRLELVRGPDDPAVRRILRVASLSTVADRPPQVLLSVSARVGRLMWKYESMPYALILKHVGVLYQTMYCVATAMELAACGLGSGDSRAFSEATGRDPLVECAVGEFALGSRIRQPQIWEMA